MRRPSIEKMEGVIAPPDDPISNGPEPDELDPNETGIIKHDGMRFCRKCDRYLPESNFHKGPARRFLCREHLKQHNNHMRYCDPVRRAVTQLKQRAWSDLRWFNQQRVEISLRTLETLLKDDQLVNPREWAILPINPDKPISNTNVKIIPNEARKRIVAIWRRGNNVKHYQEMLDALDEP